MSSSANPYPGIDKGRRGRLLAGLVVLVVVALLAWLAVDRLQQRNVTLTAVFTDSSPLVEGNRVQMNGALVGTITAIRLVDGRSHVEMDVDGSVFPFHADATAKIEPVSLLGERFVAINQGSPTAPVLPRPTTIDVAHTSAAVDLDQLLNTLDDPTSAALAAMVTTFGEGLNGNGDTVAKALRGMEPTFRSVDDISALLDKHNALLDHFIVQVQRNLDQFAPPLDPLVDGASQALGAAARNRREINDTLVEAPGTLAAARGTLRQLGDTAENTTGVLRDIRPMTDDLADVSHELRDFSDAAGPALDELPDVLHRLDTLLDEARPVVADLEGASAALAGSADGLHAVGHQLMKHKPGVASQLEELMSGAVEWGLTTTGYDGISHYFRGLVGLTPSTMAKMGAGALPAMGDRAPFSPMPKSDNGQTGDPPPGDPRLPYVPSLPPTEPDVSGPGNPGGRDPSRQGESVDEDPNSATGLTRTQEGDMFRSLLGGGK